MSSPHLSCQIQICLSHGPLASSTWVSMGHSRAIFPSSLSSPTSPSQFMAAPSSQLLKPNPLQSPLTHLFLSHPHPTCQPLFLVPPYKYTPNPALFLHLPVTTTLFASIVTSSLAPGFCPHPDGLFPDLQPEGACENLSWTLFLLGSEPSPGSCLTQRQANAPPKSTQPCTFWSLLPL